MPLNPDRRRGVWEYIDSLRISEFPESQYQEFLFKIKDANAKIELLKEKLRETAQRTSVYYGGYRTDEYDKLLEKTKREISTTIEDIKDIKSLIAKSFIGYIEVQISKSIQFRGIPPNYRDDMIVYMFTQMIELIDKYNPEHPYVDKLTGEKVRMPFVAFAKKQLYLTALKLRRKCIEDLHREERIEETLDEETGETKVVRKELSTRMDEEKITDMIDEIADSPEDAFRRYPEILTMVILHFADSPELGLTVKERCAFLIRSGIAEDIINPLTGEEFGYAKTWFQLSREMSKIFNEALSETFVFRLNERALKKIREFLQIHSHKIIELLEKMPFTELKDLLE